MIVTPSVSNGRSWYVVTADAAIASARQLCHITVLTKSSVAGTLAVYDGSSASGTLLGTIDLNAQAGTYFFGVNLANGLFLDVTNGSGFSVGVSYTT